LLLGLLILDDWAEGMIGLSYDWIESEP